MMALIGGCWVWGTVVQVEYSTGAPSLDWGDVGFGKGWALYIFWSINFSLAYNYGFWLLGLMARDVKEIPRYMSVARATEAAGQCIASGISSTSVPVSAPLFTQRLPAHVLTLFFYSLQLTTTLGINFALWGLVLLPAYLVVRQVGIRHRGPEKDIASDSGNTSSV